VEEEANIRGSGRNRHSRIVPCITEVTRMRVDVIPCAIRIVQDLKVVVVCFASKIVIVTKINSGVTAKVRTSSIHVSIHVVVITGCVWIWIVVAPTTPRSSVSYVAGIIPVIKPTVGIRVTDSPSSPRESTLKIFSENCCLC
jgi:hypothetical protein